MPDVLTKAPLLCIQAAGQPAGAVLRGRGEIDVSNVECLRRALDAAIEQGLPEAEVDLREVEFLDSSTMNVLLTTHDHLVSEGRTLRVRARPWAVRVFRLVGLDRVLHLETD
jgi:stage II sporulation protein AA (anti-sigma F factor antagonist)